MESQQQLIGVSRELGGNFANMQGTTRAIYDTAQGAGTNFEFFSNVQTRPYPFSNISQNRFETGESLAIESIALILLLEDLTTNTLNSQLQGIASVANTNGIFNFYIGNQRVIKDLDLSYVNCLLGTTYNVQGNAVQNNLNAVFRFETPIVIPPLIEFYATLQTAVPIGTEGETRIACMLQGTGTLLNTQKNF
jgi:hypothetical protein